MSRSTNSNEQISFDYTVPSQEDEYLQARLTAAHSRDQGQRRRKRSLSEDEDEDEEGDEDEDYIPGQPLGSGGGGYGGERYGIPSSDHTNHHAGMLASTSSGGKSAMTARKSQGTKPVALGPDGQPPPKKKRRRQALSCTECKRRKIRCDRVHPCAPCQRRGEGDKCKWNILEPVEKFVTRKEYDEMKDSLIRLETILSTNGPAADGVTEEVAAVVNDLKDKAGLLGRAVVSSKPGPQHHHGQSTDHPGLNGALSNPSTVGANLGNSAPRGYQGGSNATNNANTGDSSSGMVGISSVVTGSGPNATTSYGYPSFSLSVPSQSPVNHGHGDEDYYGSGQRSHSHSHSQPTPTSYSRSPLAPSPIVTHNLPYPSPVIPGHFPSSLSPGSIHNPSYQQSRGVAQIDLGGLVVEDQSSNRLLRSDYPLNTTTSSLSTLANVANSSNRHNMSIQPVQSHRPSDLHSPSLTLPPIGATGHQVTPGSERRDAEARNLSIVVPSSTDAVGTAIPTIAPPRLPITDKAGREAELRRILQTCLPRREICDRLVEYYFDKVEWSITLLHRSSFMRACEAFWFLPEDDRYKINSPTTPGSATSWGGGFRASFLPPSAEYSAVYGKPSAKLLPRATRTQALAQDDHGVNPPWISLFLALLCVSLERMGFYDAKTIGIVESVDDYQRQCRTLYDSSQGVMVLSEFLNSRAVETVQALVLHLHCQQTMSSTQWEAQTSVTLSVAARIGMMMGLNKLGAEKLGSARRPGLLKRELGRRAWWSLIERDWTLSSRVGHTYAINSSQNFCDLPVNLDWEDLELGQNAFVPQQREVWTGTSSFLCRIELARMGRELTDRYNSVEGVSYDQLMKLEDLLKETVSRAPAQLLESGVEAQQADGQKEWDRLHFTFHTHHNVITLHRPYLVAAMLEMRTQEARKAAGEGGLTPALGRHTPSYPKTVESCIRSAETVLDALEEAKALGHPGVQWWQTTIYYYTAAVVLLIERWYSGEAKPGSLEADDADERRRKIIAAIALLREQGESIELFALAANTLDSLLDATTSARRKQRKANARRGMDLNDVVNPVNVSSRTHATGNTPPFIRDWIDRPTPLLTEAVLPHTSSLSTMALLPGVPLVADSSYDSHFWARVFDLEFVDPIDLAEIFFPADGLDTAGESHENGSMSRSGSFSVSMAGGAPAWRTEVEGEAGRAADTEANGNLGASAIWGAVAGPIGSMTAGEDWARSAPYEHLK